MQSATSIKHFFLLLSEKMTTRKSKLLHVPYSCDSIPSPDRIALGHSVGTGDRQLGGVSRRETDFSLPRITTMGDAFEMPELSTPFPQTAWGLGQDPMLEAQ